MQFFEKNISVFFELQIVNFNAKIKIKRVVSYQIKRLDFSKSNWLLFLWLIKNKIDS